MSERPKSGGPAPEDWAGEMGERWLANMDRFEGMLAPVGQATADKLSIPKPRKALGPVRGGFVPLTPLAEEMVVGEGLETTLSVLVGDPSRSLLMALSTSFLREIVLPPIVRSVILLQENDPPDAHGRRPSQDTCEELGQRLLSEGRSVKIAHTPQPFKDFNDLLRHRAKGATENAKVVGALPGETEWGRACMRV